MLFAAEGYEGVSMRKIAASVGCSAAALYTLFPSKRALLRFLWEGVFQDLSATLSAAYEANAPSERVASLCVAYVAFWRARPDDYRAIFLIEDRLQSDQDTYFVESSNALSGLDIIQRSVEEAQQRGELCSGDPKAIQNVLLSAVQGLALNLITIPEYDWGGPDVLVSQTVNTIIVGLANFDSLG